MGKFKGKITAIRTALKAIYVHYGCTRYNGWGHIGKGAHVSMPSIISGKHNIFLGDNVNIDWDNVLYATNAKFIVGNNSGAAVGLTVVTGNHQRVLGKWIKSTIPTRNYDDEKDIVIGEDVWIAANVTILSGVCVGRGATIGAGAVCFKNIPPYAVVIGNPAKIVGFNFSPEEIIEHEKALYPEKDRLPLELLQSNYEKYYLNKIKEIRKYLSISF